MSEAKIRLDKWLWHARFFKTRTLAAKVVSGGHVRVNANKVSKLKIESFQNLEEHLALRLSFF